MLGLLPPVSVMALMVSSKAMILSLGASPKLTTVPAALAVVVWLLLLPQPVTVSRHASATATIAPNRAFVSGWNFLLSLETVNILCPPSRYAFFSGRGIPRAHDVWPRRRNPKNSSTSIAGREADSALAATSSLRRSRLRLPQTEQA